MNRFCFHKSFKKLEDMDGIFQAADTMYLCTCVCVCVCKWSEEVSQSNQEPIQQFTSSRDAELTAIEKLH